jgi:hypothetical protein
MRPTIDKKVVCLCAFSLRRFSPQNHARHAYHGGVEHINVHNKMSLKAARQLLVEQLSISR